MLKSAQELKQILASLGGNKNKIRRIINQNIDWDQWYYQYFFYKTNWEKYFRQIVIPNLKPKKNYTLVFWESCPGGMPFPHPNYAFNQLTINSPIHGIYDKYLACFCNKYEPNWENPRMTRQEALIALAKENIIIIDLFPTHGISLNKKERDSLYDYKNNIFKYSLNILDSLAKEIIKLNTKIICNEVICTKEIFVRLKKTHKDDINKILNPNVKIKFSKL